MSCWHWLSPCCPWSSSSTSSSLCSSSLQTAGSCVHTALTTQSLQAAHQGITPFSTVPPVETPAFRTNMMRLWLAGVSNDSHSLPHVNRTLPASKECHKAQLFPPSLEKCPVVLATLSLCWCVRENVINLLLLRHLILHCHGKSIFGK